MFHSSIPPFFFHGLDCQPEQSLQCITGILGLGEVTGRRRQDEGEEPDMCSVPLRSGRTVMAVSLLLHTIHDFLEVPQEFETELKVLFEDQSADSIFETRRFIASLMDSIPPRDSIIIDGHLRATEEVCWRLFFLAHFVRYHLLSDDAEAIAALGGLGQMIYQHLAERQPKKVCS
jgi:hypothetical protein